MSAETSTVSNDFPTTSDHATAGSDAAGMLKMVTMMVGEYRKTIQDPALRFSFGQAEDLMAMAYIQFNERRNPSTYKALADRGAERQAEKKAAAANN